MNKKYLLAFFLVVTLGIFSAINLVHAQSGSEESNSRESENSNDSEDSSSLDDDSADSELEDSSDGRVSEDSRFDRRNFFNTRKGEGRPTNPFLKKLEENNPTVLDKLKENKGQVISEIRQRVGVRFDIAVKNLDNFIMRLDERLTKIESLGEDVSTERALLDNAKSSVEDMKILAEINKAIIQDVDSTKEEVQAAVLEVKVSANGARDAVKAVIDSMKLHFTKAINEDNSGEGSDLSN